MVSTQMIRPKHQVHLEAQVECGFLIKHGPIESKMRMDSGQERASIHAVI